MHKLKVLFRPLLYTVIIISLVLVLNFTVRKPIHTVDLPRSFHGLNEHIEKEEWEEAKVKVEEVNRKWSKIRIYIILNAGLDSILDFEEALARLEKAIEKKALLAAHLELAALQVIWREFITF